MDNQTSNQARASILALRVPLVIFLLLLALSCACCAAYSLITGHFASRNPTASDQLVVQLLWAFGTANLGLVTWGLYRTKRWAAWAFLPVLAGWTLALLAGLVTAVFASSLTSAEILVFAVALAIPIAIAVLLFKMRYRF